MKLLRALLLCLLSIIASFIILNSAAENKWAGNPFIHKPRLHNHLRTPTDSYKLAAEIENLVYKFLYDESQASKGNVNFYREFLLMFNSYVNPCGSIYDVLPESLLAKLVLALIEVNFQKEIILSAQLDTADIPINAFKNSLDQVSKVFFEYKDSVNALGELGKSESDVLDGIYLNLMNMYTPHGSPSAKSIFYAKVFVNLFQALDLILQKMKNHVIESCALVIEEYLNEIRIKYGSASDALNLKNPFDISYCSKVLCHSPIPTSLSISVVFVLSYLKEFPSKTAYFDKSCIIELMQTDFERLGGQSDRNSHVGLKSSSGCSVNAPNCSPKTQKMFNHKVQSCFEKVEDLLYVTPDLLKGLIKNHVVLTDINQADFMRALVLSNQIHRKDQHALALGSEPDTDVQKKELADLIKPMSTLSSFWLLIDLLFKAFLREIG
ncbi:hypothetical protein DI09_11p220 [Mitosporidium daphniae]|uniref:Uncharacterized protein n=1 Tax=Mitosporidium daphniae TaxID=1485682 RepID=A0A098VVK0_9MICR|nr:uncharacterized protein DI09_11p220 [Mitosporidium daphniae]KGG52977.1 hypothetical protein DI09_11p220 [Mitosporidium daphniae]|eukprot:XP_013239404.1 uncharacterized protein DI09_11p220 [Mitosporidium daphniae]